MKTLISSMARNKHTSLAGLVAFLSQAVPIFFPELQEKCDALFKLCCVYGFMQASDAPGQPPAGNVTPQSKSPRLPLLLCASLGLAWLFQGCISSGSHHASQLARVQTAVKVAAFDGTAVYLRTHPEARPGFEAARDALLTLEAADEIDFATLLAIAHQFPVDKLESDTTEILIISTTILLSDFVGALPLDHVQELRPVVEAMREGIELGLTLDDGDDPDPGVDDSQPELPASLVADPE